MFFLFKSNLILRKYIIALTAIGRAEFFVYRLGTRTIVGLYVFRTLCIIAIVIICAIDSQRVVQLVPGLVVGVAVTLVEQLEKRLLIVATTCTDASAVGRRRQIQLEPIPRVPKLAQLLLLLAVVQLLLFLLLLVYLMLIVRCRCRRATRAWEELTHVLPVAGLKLKRTIRAAHVKLLVLRDGCLNEKQLLFFYHISLFFLIYFTNSKTHCDPFPRRNPLDRGPFSARSSFLPSLCTTLAPKLPRLFDPGSLRWLPPLDIRRRNGRVAS